MTAWLGGASEGMAEGLLARANRHFQVQTDESKGKCISVADLICKLKRELLLFFPVPKFHNSVCHRLLHCLHGTSISRSATIPMTHNITPAGHMTRSVMTSLTRLIAAVLLGLAGIHAHAQPGPAIPDTIAQRVQACAACHGKEGRATRDGYFPRIAGKPAGYLYNQLINFREGRRQYPLMTYMVAHLSDDYLMEMADYFSGLHLPYPPPQAPAAGQQMLERGRALVVNGDPARNIPACAACHGARLTGALPAIPSLVGLSRDYLNAQFGAWKSGARKAAPPDCMAQISRQLTPEDISAITSWLASQPIPGDMAPLARDAIKLPVPCGSAPK